VPDSLWDYPRRPRPRNWSGTFELPGLTQPSPRGEAGP